jgi:hypothetical protein
MYGLPHPAWLVMQTDYYPPGLFLLASGAAKFALTLSMTDTEAV